MRYLWIWIPGSVLSHKPNGHFAIVLKKAALHLYFFTACCIVQLSWSSELTLSSENLIQNIMPCSPSFSHSPLILHMTSDSFKVVSLHVKIIPRK